MKVKIIDCFNPHGTTLQEKYLQIKHLKSKEFEAINEDGQMAIVVNGELVDIFDGEYEVIED